MKKGEKIASSHPLFQGKPLWKVADIFNDRVNGNVNVNERVTEGANEQLVNDGAGVSNAVNENVRNAETSRKKKKSKKSKRARRQSAAEQSKEGENMQKAPLNIDVANAQIDIASPVAEATSGGNVVPEQKKMVDAVSNKQMSEVPAMNSTDVPEQEEATNANTNRVESETVQDDSSDTKKNKAEEIKNSIEQIPDSSRETGSQQFRKSKCNRVDQEEIRFQKKAEQAYGLITVSRTNGTSDSTYIPLRHTYSRHRENTTTYFGANKNQSMRDNHYHKRHFTSRYAKREWLCTICKLQLYTHQLFKDHMKKRHPKATEDRVSSLQPPKHDVSLVSYAEKTKGTVDQQEQGNRFENGYEESVTPISIVLDSTTVTTDESRDTKALPTQENGTPLEDTMTDLEAAKIVTNSNSHERLNWADEMTRQYDSCAPVDTNGVGGNEQDIETMNPAIGVSDQQFESVDAVDDVGQDAFNSERTNDFGEAEVSVLENENIALDYVTGEEIVNFPESSAMHTVLSNELNHGYIEENRGYESAAVIGNQYVLIQEHPDSPYPQTVPLITPPIINPMFHQFARPPQGGVMAPTQIQYYSFPPQHSPRAPIVAYNGYPNMNIYVGPGGNSNMYPTAPPAARVMPDTRPGYIPIVGPQQPGMYQFFLNPQHTMTGTIAPQYTNSIPIGRQPDGKMSSWSLNEHSIMEPDPHMDKKKTVQQNSMPPGNGVSLPSSDGGYASPTEATATAESNSSDTTDDAAGQNGSSDKKDK